MADRTRQRRQGCELSDNISHSGVRVKRASPKVTLLGPENNSRVSRTALAAGLQDARMPPGPDASALRLT